MSDTDQSEARKSGRRGTALIAGIIVLTALGSCAYLQHEKCVFTSPPKYPTARTEASFEGWVCEDGGWREDWTHYDDGVRF